MTRPIELVLIACAYVLVSCAQAYGASWDIVVFRDDFDASLGGMPNPDDWVVNHPGAWWWVQGRTHFPNPDPWLSDGKFPRRGKYCFARRPVDLFLTRRWPCLSTSGHPAQPGETRTTQTSSPWTTRTVTKSMNTRSTTSRSARPQQSLRSPGGAPSCFLFFLLGRLCG